MVLSNADRQRRFRKRKAQAVTADDVVRAVRILYDSSRQEMPWEKLPPFDEWVAGLKGKRVKLWEEFVPVDPDREAWAHFPEEDRKLLIRVAAVMAAAKRPPAPE